MALSDLYPLSTLRALVRRDLAEPSAHFWSDSELNIYINDWQNALQNEYEFIWGITTATQTISGTNATWDFFTWDNSVWDASGSVISLATVTFSSVAPAMLRPDAIYFIVPDGSSAHRIVPRDLLDLDAMRRDWRTQTAEQTPLVAYQQTNETVSFWPPPTANGTLIFEYPVLLTLTADIDTMRIPAWTRYTCSHYVLYRAFARFGATQNLGKAAFYKTRWDRDVKRISKNWHAYMPQSGERLRPGRKWAQDILNPRRTFQGGGR